MNRLTLRRKGIKLPRGLHAHRVTGVGNPWYEVRDSTGRLHWEGTASDAIEARANAIDEICKHPKPECGWCVYNMGHGCEDTKICPGNSDAACHGR